MTNQYRHEMFPDLPQYGKPVACCQGGFPEGAWMRIGAIAMCAMISLPMLALCLKPLPQEFKEGHWRWGIILLTVAVPTIVAFAAAMFIEKSVRKSPIFIFDGGIHFDEQVRYMIADGNFMTFYSGTRQVSLPWRVLNNFRVRESRPGESLMASFKLPDGRTMQVDTADGANEALAVKTISEKLKS